MRHTNYNVIVCELSKKHTPLPPELEAVILHLRRNDIDLVRSIMEIINSHLGRCHIYVGSGNPAATNVSLIRSMKKTSLSSDSMSRLSHLLREKKLPVELAVVPAPTSGPLHVHKVIPSRKTDLQVEFYLIPDRRIAQFAILVDHKKSRFTVNGPCCVIFGDVPHVMLSGSCFVVKHISGRHKITIDFPS